VIPFSSNPYLDLLKRTVTGMIYEDPPIPLPWRPATNYIPTRRVSGRDWPSQAHTMVGIRRLDNLQACIETVIADGIDGDLIETGVWRGGACIFMRGMLHAYNIINRTVWVADSFAGFPAYLEHEGDRHLAFQPEQRNLAVSQDEVKRNFNRYGLLDDQVQFLPGWFADTLPGPVRNLAVLRLDSDLYASTMDSITPLYPLLQPGGFCIVDDWNVPTCREGICEYRDSRGIAEPIVDIDGHGVYWRKS